MIRHALALAAALALGFPGAAAAQDTPVGGEVAETLALGIEPVSGFETFPAGPRTETLAIDAEVTSTGAQAVLDVEDEAAPGSRAAGRMRGGAGLLDAPLEGRVDGAFQPLDARLAEPLATFSRPVTRAPTRIVLRQRIGAGERPRGTYEKTLLITLSTGTP